MKTNYLKITLAWIAFICAIVLFSFSISFAQSGIKGKVYTHIEKEINGVPESFDRTLLSTDNNFGDPEFPNVIGIAPSPVHLPVPIPGPDTVPIPIIHIDSTMYQPDPGKRMSKEINMDAEDLSIYPNPAVGEFTVNFHSDNQGDLKVRIADISGREVISETLAGFIGDYNNQFNLGDKAKGVYILSVELNNSVFTKKILLN